jgi:hypothetical protein
VAAKVHCNAGEDLLRGRFYDLAYYGKALTAVPIRAQPF